MEQYFVVLSEPRGQVPHGLLACLPLIRDMRDEVRRHIPLPFFFDLHDGLHDGEPMGRIYLRKRTGAGGLA